MLWENAKLCICCAYFVNCNYVCSSAYRICGLAFQQFTISCVASIMVSSSRCKLDRPRWVHVQLTSFFFGYRFAVISSMVLKDEFVHIFGKPFPSFRNEHGPNFSTIRE